jgi:hypothetical protein
LRDGDAMGCGSSGVRVRGGEGVGLEEWMLMGELDGAGVASGGGDTVLGEPGRKSGSGLVVIACGGSRADVCKVRIRIVTYGFETRRKSGGTGASEARAAGEITQSKETHGR